MIRLETKQVGVDSSREIGGDMLKGTVPLYSHEIREVLGHFPTGHYISLVSAFCPFSTFDNIGYIEMNRFDNDTGEFVRIVNYVNEPVRSLDEFLARLQTQYGGFYYDEDRGFYCKVDEKYRTGSYLVKMSPTAAWYMGFEGEDGLGFVLGGDKLIVWAKHKRPPLLVKYLQIVCKNACGTRDSNMAMPTTLGILHVTEDNTLASPHIAVNSRINEGREIRIEILDQDDQPFRWAPVYLELYVSESPDHEKRQGFFRFEKEGTVHFHEPVKNITIPDILAEEKCRIFYIRPSVNIEVRVVEERGHVARIFQFTAGDLDGISELNGRALTLNAWKGVFESIKYRLVRLSGDTIYNWGYCLHFSYVDGQMLVKIKTGHSRLDIFADPDFLACLGYRDLTGRQVRVTGRRVRIDPGVFYTADSRLLVYCREYHDKIPVAVARNVNGYYKILNPNFWAWHELEKPTNVLRFRFERRVRPWGGEETVDHSLREGSGLIMQLFYK